ncbi:hypothetical protein FRB91_001276 [Serendipita sp. 411]|nr:hypothetical protein FRB91_001276 [Serendipita sp. 411]
MATIEEVLPLSRRGEMTDKKTLLVAQSRLAGWSDTYNLPSRLRAHASQEETVRRNEWAKAQVFQAYVGALFKEHGYEFVDEWFGEIVEHTIKEVLELEQAALVEAFDRTTIGMPGTRDDHRPSSSSFSENDTPSTSNRNMRDRESPLSPGGFSAQGASPPRRPAPGGAPENNANLQSPLSQFNQRCAQKHIQPQWAFINEGPQHGPIFRATVTLPGEPEPIGLGEGPTKAAAKQLAAEMALCILDEA